MKVNLFWLIPSLKLIKKACICKVLTPLCQKISCCTIDLIWLWDLKLHPKVYLYCATVSTYGFRKVNECECRKLLPVPKICSDVASLLKFRGCHMEEGCFLLSNDKKRETIRKGKILNVCLSWCGLTKNASFYGLINTGLLKK